MNRSLRFGFLLLALSLQAGCGSAREYTAEPVEGWIVDAETKEPVEGAVVVMSWPLYGGFIHADVTGYLYIGESVTDKNGRFYFPAWGPRKAKDAIHLYSPFFSILKSGYFYKSMSEPNVAAYENPLKTSWNHTTTELKRAGTDVEKYAMSLITAYKYHAMGTCTWELIPRYTAELINTQIEHAILPVIPSWSALSYGGDCKDARQLLKKYMRN